MLLVFFSIYYCHSLVQGRSSKIVTIPFELMFTQSDVTKLCFSDDIVRAVKKLRVLGSGLEVVATGSSQFIYSIPGELSMDHTALLQHVRLLATQFCSSIV